MGGTLNVFDSRFEENGSGDKHSHGGGIANINTTGQILSTALPNNSSAGCRQGIPCSYPGGGGIYLNNSSITIQDNIFINNTALFGGGGINNQWGLVTIINSTFYGNSGGIGGGIANNGTMTIAHSTISGNNINGAGGSVFNTRYLTNNNSIFSGNGGVDISNSGDMTITNSTFSGNKGGGISNGGNITIANSTFSHNSAAYGGGIANFPRVPDFNFLTITNSTFTGNHAANYGGGIYSIMMHEVIITNSSFYDNSADGGGGGIYNDMDFPAFPTPFTLTNTNITNSLSGGNCVGLIIDGGHNLDSDNTCAFDPANGSLPGTYPLLGPLKDNGGPTLTHALLWGNPAIDAGDNAQCPPTDQRGITRPLDGIGDRLAMCDIGSFEVNEPFHPQNP